MADMNQSVHFIRSFALKVFSSADEEDRNGLADLYLAALSTYVFIKYLIDKQLKCLWLQ